jgi:hypothetical protein
MTVTWKQKYYELEKKFKDLKQQYEQSMTPRAPTRPDFTGEVGPSSYTPPPFAMTAAERRLYELREVHWRELARRAEEQYDQYMRRNAPQIHMPSTANFVRYERMAPEQWGDYLDLRAIGEHNAVRTEQPAGGHPEQAAPGAEDSQRGGDFNPARRVPDAGTGPDER